MVINHLIRTVLLLVLLSTCVGAIKPTNPHSVKPIPSRESADPYKGQRIEGDGNCFYRSLSLYLYDSQEYHRNVRQQILTFMSDREDQYQRLIGRNVNYRDYARYISDHRRDGVWAEDAIVQAAADLYGIDIYVTHYSSYRETSQPLQVTRARTEQFRPSGQNSQRWLHLQLHLQESHYEIINDYTEEGVSEPSYHSDLISIQDPAEIETLGMQESRGGKLIPEEEMPVSEIKDPPMEKETTKKKSESKVIPDGVEAEILHPKREERKIHIPHSSLGLPDEELPSPPVEDIEMTEKIDPSTEDNVDNICRGFNVVKIHEEEKDFEDQHQKKRIKNTIYQFELKHMTDSKLIWNERDLTSGRPIAENLGRLEDLHIELGEEACVNEVLRSDSEESIENRTYIPLEKKIHDSQLIQSIHHLREMIRNEDVGFGSHFRVRRQLGFYQYFHHFFTLEANNQSMTLLHLAITLPLNIFCEQSIVNFSNFNNTFFNFSRGVELLHWYAIPTNKTTLDKINKRIEEVMRLGYINYSLTSPDKMYCASLVSYILIGEKDHREVFEFICCHGVSGIYLILFVNCICYLISNIRYFYDSVAKFKAKLTDIFQLFKLNVSEKFYSFLSCLCFIWDLVANFVNMPFRKNEKKTKESDEKGG